MTGIGELMISCKEYSDWVAADVDGREDSETIAARKHAQGCSRCRAIRDSQMVIRSFLRSRDRLPVAPIGLRTRILAQLEEEPVGRKLTWRLGGWLVAVATAAALLLLVGTPPGERVGDVSLIAYARALSDEIPPTIEVGNVAEAEAYYLSHEDIHHAPTHVPNLRGAGFLPVGVRIDKVAGVPRRFTYYEDGQHRIICDYRFAREFFGELPEGQNPIFFQQDGLAICVTRIGDEVCILASKMPLGQMVARLLGWT